MYIDIPNLLNLSVVAGVGTIRLRSLIAKFRSPEEVFRASIKDLTSVDGIDTKTAQKIKNYSNFNYGEQQYKKAINFGAKIITFWDKEYPLQLKNIFDPPVLLYLMGEIQESDKFAIAIVGTRMPTNYGKLITERLTKEIANKGFTIVSGLARGVDTIAHSASIKLSGRTLAVIGTGIDIIYPSENKKIFKEIINNGAILSEYPMGTPPDAINFPKRNRIIAGLSLGIIVVEAGVKSGALITANLALEYNREVFAVPGNITSLKSKGTNQLIKEGAKLINSVDDVFEELKPYLNKFSVKDKLNKNILHISSEEKIVFESLSDDPIHIDELARKLKKSPAEILSILLSLEFKDLVAQLPGKMFVKA